MADIKKDFYDFLRSLGIDDDDAKKASEKHASAIADTAAKASKSTSTTSSGGNSVASALGAAFIDQQAQTLARINTETGKKILNTVKGMATFNPLELISTVFDAGLATTEVLLGDIAKLNAELLEKTRGAGGYVGRIATEMMDTTRFAMIEAQRFGVTTNETISAVESLMVNSERMATYNDKTISNSMVASLAFTKNSKTILENAENFRNVGIGLDGAAKSIEQIGSRSIKLGLSAKATSETLISQLGKLNAFGFQNGIAGLGKMVQEAQALKINMESIFTVADKLYDPESAINLAANLQVVGGAVGDLADPIKLMYDATNNVESLQTSIIGAARSLATYNAEQGRFEVSGANLRRAKAMADSLGISMGELTNMAVKGAAKFEAMSELNMFPSLTDDQREFVSNIATIKDGKVGFDIPKNMVQQMGLTNVKDGFVSLSDLTDKQLAELQDLQKKAADEKPIDIARNQFNETTKILNVATAIYLRLMEDVRSGPAGDAAANLMKKAVDFTENINPTQNNTAQTVRQVYGEATGAAGEALDKIIDKVKGGMPKEVQETINYLETKLSDITKDLNIQEKATEVLEKAKELIERGIEKGKDAYENLKGFTGAVDIKVDINSNSTQLAGIVVDELSKNPQMRAEFVSNIVKSTKTFA
jgi:hypothetical protein